MRWLFVFAGLGAQFFIPRQIAGEDILKWKFEPGEILNYTLTGKQVTEGSIAGGNVITTTMESTGSVELVIEMVEPNGNARIAQTCRRIQIRMEAGGSPFGNVNVDSEKATKNPTLLEREVASAVEKLIGQKSIFVMSPQGEILTTAVTPDLATPTTVDFTEQITKNLTLNLAVPLCAEPIKIGDTWQSILKIESGPFSVEKSSSLKFNGTEAGVAKIAAMHQVRVMAAEFPNIKVNVDKSSKGVGTGSIQFDIKRGRVSEVLEDCEYNVRFSYGSFTGSSKVKSKTRVYLSN